MSPRAIEHLEEWIRENINDTIYPADGDDSGAKAYAEQYRQAAQLDGVVIAEVEAGVGSIEDRMAEAIEESVDRELERASNKDRS